MIVFNQHIDRQLNNGTQYKAFLESHIYKPMIYTAFFFPGIFWPKHTSLILFNKCIVFVGKNKPRYMSQSLYYSSIPQKIQTIKKNREKTFF